MTMIFDPSIYFALVIPDWAPNQSTPTQGFSLSLTRMSWALRRIALLPANVFDLSDLGRDTLLSRRMCGSFPLHWYGQSPRAIRALTNVLPFLVVILPESESASDYKEWAEGSPVRPTLVAKTGGDLSYNDLAIEPLKAHFLTLCDGVPSDNAKKQIDEARDALKQWAPVPSRELGYKVGGHNSVAPNIVALALAGFDDGISGPFKEINSGIKPYVDQIVKASQTILDERAKVEPRGPDQIFRKPPDINLFSPAFFPSFFELPAPPTVDKSEKKRFETLRQSLARQTGYNFEARTEAQQAAIVGKNFSGAEGQRPDTHPIMSLRAAELSLNTELMSVVAASEFSAVVRLPNEINRTAGSVRNFAEHYRSDQSPSRKRLLAFREVQARLAGAFPNEFLGLVRQSKTGIRIVSDAHLEWLDVDGLPLSIRKDCARVPVTPGNLFVDHLAAKPAVRLTPEDFQSILVISALKRTDPIRNLFKIAFDTLAEEDTSKRDITFAEVTNEDELVKALNDFDGPLVIFDGHGSHNKDNAAVLHLGDNTVDVWGLKDKLDRIAPIIVLSACDTHAADRNHATTANGFLSVGARAVLSSVFPLEARAAATLAARLVLRASTFLGPFVRAFDQPVTWMEVMSGMLRMQLLTDFLRLLLTKGKIDEAGYKKLHADGNIAINSMAPDPFGTVVASLEKLGIQGLKLDLETAIANSSVISYLHVGRPETIVIDDPERMQAKIEGWGQSDDATS